MKSFRFFSLCLISALFVSPALSESEPPLSLTEVIEATLAYHPLIRANDQVVRQADARNLNARGAFDPKLVVKSNSYLEGYYSGSLYDTYVEQPTSFYGLRALGGYRRSGGKFPDYDGQYNTNEDGETRIGIQLPLLRDFAIDDNRAKVAQTESKIRVAESKLRKLMLMMVRDASYSYWDWIGAAKKYQVFESLLKVARVRQEQLQERVEVGDLARFDLIDNQRALLKRNSELIKAKQNLAKSRLKLSLYYLDSNGEPRNVSERRLITDFPLPVIDIPDDISGPVAESLARRPELAELRFEREVTQIALRFAKNQLLPRLDSEVVAANDFGAGPKSRDEAEIKGGLNLEIPLRTRKQDGLIAESEARLSEIAELERAFQQKIDREVNKAIVGLRLSMERTRIAKQEFDAASILEGGERERFGFGDSNLIFVNLREQTTADAAVSLIDAQIDFNKAKADYRVALGDLAR
jgi:outer membrane protein TolC